MSSPYPPDTISLPFPAATMLSIEWSDVNVFVGVSAVAATTSFVVIELISFVPSLDKAIPYCVFVIVPVSLIEAFSLVSNGKFV